MSKVSLPDLAHLTTESVNPRSRNISALPTAQILRVINDEDATVPGALSGQLPIIARVVDDIVPRLRKGGRVVYFGAGTSGRLGVVDASECLPTFNSEQFVGLMAGGDSAVRRPAEGIEDLPSHGSSDLASLSPPLNPTIDTAVGIASSGRTPYVKGALQYAYEIGCITVCIVCVKQSELAMMKINGENIVKHVIEIVVGPEVVTGSTRMKAGTATKMVLNMLSTACMIRLGKTYGNYMIDLRVSNAKLRSRAHRFIRLLCPTPTRASEEIDALLATCSNSVKLAILVARTGWEVDHAKEELDRVNGRLDDLLDIEPPNRGNTFGGQNSQLETLPLFLCVDGGGTTTRAVIVTVEDINKHPAQVRILGIGLSGPSNIATLGVDVAVSTISSAIQDALTKFSEVTVSGAEQFPVFEKAWIGCAGIDPSTRLQDAALFRERISTVLSVHPSSSDLRITSDAALLSSLLAVNFVSTSSQDEEKYDASLDSNTSSARNGGGIVLISGTGSIGLLFSSEYEQIERVGGLGYLLGDEGSAFHLGREAIRWVFEHGENEGNNEDLTIPEGTALKKLVLESFGVSKVGELISCIYSTPSSVNEGTTPKGKIASLARGVLDLAFNSEDSISLQLVKAETQALASVVARLVKIQIKRHHISLLLTNGSPPSIEGKVRVKIVCAGGMMHHHAFRKMVEKGIALISIPVKIQDADVCVAVEIDGNEMILAEDPAKRGAEQLIRKWMGER